MINKLGLLEDLKQYYNLVGLPYKIQIELNTKGILSNYTVGEARIIGIAGELYIKVENGKIKEYNYKLKNI